MERDTRPGQRREAPGNDAAGVRTPPEGTIPSSDTILPDDSPTLVHYSSDSPTLIDVLPNSPATPPRGAKQKPKPVLPSDESTLNPGMLLADRYEIVQILGQGGMGAVYKATDVELNRTVALKVIRPELAREKAIVDRFKQELLLSHQVTHRNVIRIYDLNDSEGMKFITMEYVEGENLHTLIREKKKFSTEEAVEIMRQVCLALQAAHAVGVIHRDLKPQNIMRDTSGRIVVMDFGLARTLEGDGMTQSGALMGTMEYMSPEQALGKHLDQRSDIFALGLIFYEMLTGLMPFKADSAIASLIRRTQERVSPVSDHDNSIPASVSSIVAKCLERDLDQRFKTATELLSDLESWQGIRAAATLKFPSSSRPWGQTIPWHWIGAVAAVLVLAFAGMMLRGRFTIVSPAKGHPVSVLVADFTNHTGDPVFDGTLEPMFNVALEGASFINAYSRESARKLAQKLPHPGDKLDEQAARLVAVGESVSAVISGDVTFRGDKYTVSAIALDAVTGNVLANAEVSAANKEAIPHEIPKLVAPIRKALGDVTPESEQFHALSGAFNIGSLEALHVDAMGIQQQYAGKYQEALQSFSKAVEADPNFAAAYAGMAAMSENLGKREDAERYIKLAMQHEDRMTERERSRTRGLYYAKMGDWQKCIDEYTQLVSRYPADRVGHVNLAICYAQSRNIPKAIEESKRAVELVPKGAQPRLNLAFYSSLGGDFQAGEREARAALELSPSAPGYLFVAEAQLGQGQLSQAADTYHTLEKLNASGASIASSGLADLAAYQGRFADAVPILEKGAAVDLAAKDAENAATKYVALGRIQLWRGERRPALEAAGKALALNQAVSVRFLAAQIYAEAGELAKAQKLASSLASDLKTEPQVYGKIIEAKIALKHGDKRAGINTLLEANKLLDTWIGHLELGRAYLDAGLFVEADSEFDRCIRRRGEAMELFQDNVPTYAVFPAVYCYQGRVREGLKSPGSVESYRNYLAIRGQSTEDPIVAEVRKALGQ